MFKLGLVTFSILFTILLVTSCSDDPTGNNPIARSPIKELNEYIPFELPENLNKDNIRGFVKITKIFVEYTEFGSLPPTFQTLGIFKDNTDFFVDAGVLDIDGQKFNGKPSDNYDDGSVLYQGKYIFEFDNREYSVTLSGNTFFPGFSVSLKSPLSDVMITNIKLNDSFSRLKDLAITWSGARDTVNNQAVVNIRIPKSNSEGDDYLKKYDTYKFYTKDTGSFTIPSSFLKDLQKGNFLVSLQVGRSVYTEVNPGKYAYVTIYSSHEIECNFLD